MNQYQHTAAARPRPPVVTPTDPTYMQQQLMETVRRLALLTDQQGRQIRRLETQLQQLDHTVSAR